MVIRMNTPLLISAAAVVVAALVAMGQVPALFGALGTPRLAEDKTTALLDEYLADHEADLESYRKRFDGRSFFFKPRPPRRERVVRPAPTEEEEPVVVEPTGPPKSYTGPSIIFVLGNEVFFHGGLRLRIGDEEKEGVTVIASNAPWSVTLGHADGEYELEIFKRKFPGLETSPQTQRPTPGLVLVEGPDESRAGEDSSGARKQ